MTGLTRSPDDPLACVVGEISMVRPLGRKGIPVALATSEPDSPITHSRYCKAVVALPSWVSEPDRAVAALIDWGRTQRKKPVLFYQGDHDLVAISRARERLAEVFRFVIPSAAIVEALTDKLQFEDLARACDLPVPRTLRLQHGEDFLGRLQGWDKFPAVLKPSMRSNWYATIGCQQKALRVETREELHRQLLLLGNQMDLLVQAAVEGGEEQIVNYHAYVRADGSIAAEFTGRKIRTAPRLYGISSHVQITDDARVKQAGRSLVQKLGFTGVLKADFKIDIRDQGMFLLEINPRFNLWHHPGTVAGVPIPQIVYDDCIGAPPRYASAPQITRHDVRWVDPVLDWMAFKEYRAAGELTRGRWLMQLATADVNEGFTLRDPAPGLMALRARFESRFAKWFGGHAVRAGL
jgi:predicted ATP-grasp superfamily ATP-dependent carboligase